MMKLVFKGENWSYAKKGEFVEAAIQEFSMNNPGFTQRDWLTLMEGASQSGEFARGKDHAEGVFFATAGLISHTSMDPLAIRAREAAKNLPPLADMGSAMLWVTVREFLHSEFPKEDFER